MGTALSRTILNTLEFNVLFRAAFRML